MKNGLRIILAVSVLALAMLACQALAGGGDSPSTDSGSETDTNGNDTNNNDTPSILPTKGPDVLLRDSFNKQQWGTGSDENSSVQYIGDALNFLVVKDFYYVWSTPDAEIYDNVHIEVTAQNNSTDPLGTFGIICNLQVTDTSYYFAINGSGTYAISRSMIASDDVVLTNDGDWTKSDLITENASSYRIGADCASDGTLTLYVDGKEIDSVNDTTYTSGNVGLFAWSDEQVSGTDVTFDDFLMTELP
jgi:hypothetical protein